MHPRQIRETSIPVLPSFTYFIAICPFPLSEWQAGRVSERQPPLSTPVVRGKDSTGRERAHLPVPADSTHDLDPVFSGVCIGDMGHEFPLSRT